MQQQLMHFCDVCGAANFQHTAHCFACQTPLSSSSSAQVAFTSVPVGNGAVALKLADAEESHISASLAPGFLLGGRYTILEQVGEGGFGIVYKARDRKQRNKLVAVKQINLDQLSPRDMIQATDSYNREVRLHSPLRQKHLPRVYDHFTDPRNWYLIMEYIQGETLEDYLKRAPGSKLALKEVLNIGIQLCDVLSYLHTKHTIVFRDVKPANIMRTQRGKLYLIDFGIARRYMPGKRKDTGALGSPGYAAPEQYGTAQTNARTDIYGLGATLLALLTGIDPAEDVSAGTASESQPPAIPEKLQALLDQMLSRTAEQRPESVQAVKEKLISIRDGMLRRTARAAQSLFAGILIGAVPYVIYALALPTQLYSILACMAPFALAVVMFAGILLLFYSGKRLLGLGMIVAIVLLTVLLIIGHIMPLPIDMTG